MESVSNAFNILLDHCAQSDCKFNWPQNRSNNMCRLLDWTAPSLQEQVQHWDPNTEETKAVESRLKVLFPGLQLEKGEAAADL